jgi:hypothetical protein
MRSPKYKDRQYNDQKKNGKKISVCPQNTTDLATWKKPTKNQERMLWKGRQFLLQ